jgi:PAS domain S-box-containing protein
MNGLKILYLEDTGKDLAIVMKVFQNEKVEVNLKHTDNRDGFLELFHEFKPDIILSELKTASFDGFEALDIVRRENTEIPFIFLSGDIDETTAIKLFKNGATDYVLKNRISRLVPAITRALLEIRERARRIHAEKIQQKYDFIVNTSRSMFTLVDRNYVYEAVNDAFCQAHNLVREKIIGKTLWDLWGKDTFEKFIKNYCDQSFSDNVVRYQAWFHVPYHGMRCFEVTFYPYKEYGTEVTHSVVNTMDITDRQKAEDALRESEIRYRMLFDHASQAILLVRENKIQTCNAAALEIFGESKNNILDRSLSDLSPVKQPDGIASEKKLKKYEQQALNDGPVEFEWLLKRSDQSLIESEISLNHFKLGTLDFFQYFIHDISERKKAEAQQALLYMAIEHSADMVCITDDKRNLEYVNSSYLEVTGYTYSEIIGNNYNTMLSSEHNDEFHNQISKCIGTENGWRGNMKIRKKNGEPIEVYSSISPVKNSKGDIIKYVSVQRDITDETRLQNYLQRAQRMETVGTLAGGIAHDFNNILATIIGHADIALHDLSRKHPSYRDLEQIMKASNRARELVNQILTFSRQMESKIEPVQLLSHIEEVVKMLEGSISPEIKIKTELNKNCPKVLGDLSHVHQVIMNICTNAIHAMHEKGGQLKIRMTCLKDTDKLIKTHPELQEKKYVRIDFIDTGKGINPEIIDRIFEPFFTTKPVGEGTGLGLSVVHGMIKNMQGDIFVESTPEKGSRFTIVLPAWEE